ncbi:metallophosphoesterase [Bacteroides reticulotermitis]|uniref:metallophosphoesterase n=1 Tax=Bacteroides reticulotermitis TaxID=1133319 RepID=UPI003A8B76CD
MMKKIVFPILWVVSVFMLGGCSSDDEPEVTVNPFDIMSDSNNDGRNKIVVISDLHLGADLTYSETVNHLNRLEQFLNEVRSSATIKELVLNGDIFDEWYVPTRTNTYGDGSQAHFIRKTVAANQRIFDLFNAIIKDGKIKLTYIPGNHDMGFTAKNVDIAMPGVNQARDSNEKFGIGTYHPDGYPEIAIEHGHRYDFFSALTPGANESEAPDATLPPGYFFARIAANSFTDPTTPEAATKVPIIPEKDQSNPEQYSKYVYYSLWKYVMEKVIYVKDNFSDNIIKTNVGNFTKTYSINDVLPYSAPDGSIQMKLYNGLFTQTHWSERLKYNNAIVMTDINKAIKGSLETEFIDAQSQVQYFHNKLSEVRVVVFGHTHLPMIKSYTNLDNKPCVYANSGTWEDRKTRDKNAVIDQDVINMNFVTIYPVQGNKDRMQVALYQYKYGKHMLVSNKEVDL